jgi:hypothetical protein
VLGCGCRWATQGLHRWCLSELRSYCINTGLCYGQFPLRYDIYANSQTHKLTPTADASKIWGWEGLPDPIIMGLDCLLAGFPHVQCSWDLSLRKDGIRHSEGHPYYGCAVYATDADSGIQVCDPTYFCSLNICVVSLNKFFYINRFPPAFVISPLRPVIRPQ